MYLRGTYTCQCAAQRAGRRLKKQVQTPDDAKYDVSFRTEHLTGRLWELVILCPEGSTIRCSCGITVIQMENQIRETCALCMREGVLRGREKQRV